MLQYYSSRGTQINYVIGGENRSVGKTVNRTLVQGFLYENQLEPVAELDGKRGSESGNRRRPLRRTAAAELPQNLITLLHHSRSHRVNLFLSLDCEGLMRKYEGNIFS